jgi:xanthine dehydrogenase accessory factor
MGYTVERLLRAPKDGHVTPIKEIGDHVETGEIVAAIGGTEIKAQITGVLRGMIHPSVYVTGGMKIGDVDPRNEREHCFSITDKALAIAGGVLEAVMAHANRC